MPYYSRYRRRTGYSKYRRRYGYRRLGYRRYRRRTTGGSVTSRSRVRVKVQCEEVVQLTIAANTVNSTVCSSVPFAHYGTGDPPTLSPLERQSRRSIVHIVVSLIKSSVTELSRRFRLRHLLAQVIRPCLPFRL